MTKIDEYGEIKEEFPEEKIPKECPACRTINELDAKFCKECGCKLFQEGTEKPEEIVYVADTYNHRIQKFTSDGNFITKWGRYGSGDGEIGIPEGIAVTKI